METGSSSSLDFGFAFNDANFSDRSLQVKITPRSKPDHAIDSRDQAHQGDGNPSRKDYPAKTIHVSTMLLAAKSPFFYKLFSNGMSESNKLHQCVTLQIHESEEAAFMDMLKFMYTNVLSSTTPSALVNVLITADKYEVQSCMKYCLGLLSKLRMTCESALLYLDLPSTILMDDTVQQLKKRATEFLVALFKDTSKFQEELLNLPLAAVEAILSRDDLQVDSEDEVYDFVMEWAQTNYTKQSERQEILNTRLLCLIRFHYMSCEKLKGLIECTDICPKCSAELIYEALSPHQQSSGVLHEKERAYKLRPVKVTRFSPPREECIVYLDLKREECLRLYPSNYVLSQPFDLRGQEFYLLGKCQVNDKPLGHSFGFYLQTQENGCLGVDFEFSSRRKPSEEFEGKMQTDYDFSKPMGFGFPDLFDVPWKTFIAKNSPYFINGVLHLRATIRIKK